MQEKLLWQSTLRSLVTDEPGTPQTVNLASPLLSGSFVLKQQIKKPVAWEQLEFLQTDFNGVHHQCDSSQFVLAKSTVAHDLFESLS